ncbi:uncharacterized protein THITE_2112265 [Thermothielavioides terrestris NRRL 8126]|uniref:Uncharacterized protein n=1 Tax=Thermothielavioides terrestris (strain ATCC 38088 / NRRL 8126) TaxID=578455 RepID=G2QY62_THETT|nr:uncharacterized protein THITE_2112265 [Thermothielavioides terrestris NRRL 8126]AEO65356.1 hypothetical protein THITE_2112265 [Thermothielavioides terrestris NRRL 8126]
MSAIEVSSTTLEVSSTTRRPLSQRKHQASLRVRQDQASPETSLRDAPLTHQASLRIRQDRAEEGGLQTRSRSNHEGDYDPDVNVAAS